MGCQYRISLQEAVMFNYGNNCEIYRKMGAHPAREKFKEGTCFSVWAPNAVSVRVAGSFNGWNQEQYFMSPIGGTGVWEIFIPYAGEGDTYKYVIETKQGEFLYKADPYGSFYELRPGNASVITDLKGFNWQDGKWMESHADRYSESPVSVYEVHPGSWKRKPDGSFLSYRELAHQLCDYVKEMGYTFVELMGICEHPFDGSWGYQVSGYYAPTSRYGSPKDFMYFVNHMHKNGIGVILDWVPAHFPKDDFGLGRFDGTPLYEYPDPRKGEHPQWGTYCFNYSRTEVSSFLTGSALSWPDRYHVDGLRVDAVSSMLYLDFGRKSGEWIPNENGGNESYEAIDFIRHLNSEMARRYPGVMMIAEESSAWPMVTGDTGNGGLGFTYKWNMGWMHDFLDYMQCDPVFRSGRQTQITFSFAYALSERFMLALSHDEVVHLKKSMLLKMPGDMPSKFGNLKAAYGLMVMHPGKKLLFMGQEFGQLKEWNESEALDWQLLHSRQHRQLQSYVRELLHFYRQHGALWELDDSPEGFEWINGSDADHNMLTFVRKTGDGRFSLLCHFNFSPVAYENFRSGVPCPGVYREVFNSNDTKFGGSGWVNREPVYAERIGWDMKDYSIGYRLGSYGVCIFEFDHTAENEAATAEAAQQPSYWDGSY